jgi:hypothetical protein
MRLMLRSLPFVATRPCLVHGLSRFGGVYGCFDLSSKLISPHDA